MPNRVDPQIVVHFRSNEAISMDRMDWELEMGDWAVMVAPTVVWV